MSSHDFVSRREVCPTHGPVYAVLWKGQLVCPDPECHRTCSLPPDEGIHELTDLRCSVCGSLEIAIVNGANEAHCLAHLPDQWRPLFEPPLFDPEETL